MVALLYREWLCLATASKCDQIYTIQACIALSNIKLEEVDNGRGLPSQSILLRLLLTRFRTAMPHGAVLVEDGVHL